MARVVVEGSQEVTNIEYDMHGVLAREGLYLEITNSTVAGGGTPNATTRHAVSVEFN